MNIIEVSGLSKTYVKRKTKEPVKAVNDISFSVRKGEILGLLGPNGAGKTTTIKMLCGLLKPDQGSILINGVNNAKQRLQALHHISAVLEGNRNLYWRLTVRENLEYFAGNRGFSRKQVAHRIDTLLVLFNLKEKENELVNRLSRGMQQKLAIAVAMLAETEVILLDEPTLGLDVETSYEVRAILKEIVKDEDRTIIITSHDMAVIQEVCQRTIIINHGKVVADEEISNLMRLFDVRAYTVTLGAELTPAQQALLESEFITYDYQADLIQPLLSIELTHAEQLYQLFDILKRNETPVEQIDRRTINFEEVFIKIVKGEAVDETSLSISSELA
ncbi:ABC-2 type transport system ATP-binding protein [Amphibacillus marinus]|uniref:ABC-2 type transport system ATP-binding protein n=1 Tax=Amphibacillus marinus TaxID=872970 RepID=A0A1H8ILF7_9BACI|nr:ABC transporter ATP-binding protein [Amphibacillus marinus]SEN69364.1 ABC-2 type transport system ATP-binding protein [Amphibacillus marinus]